MILGSEWIGSLVKYKQESRCYSKLYSDNDLNYTDILGRNNDECEYFCNGAIQNERFFVQNYVFDAAFEVKLDFERIEVDFIQQNASEKMPVTSNPFFAFHDDVFPAFSKNAVSQSRFPKPAITLFGPVKKTVIPDNFFTLPEDFLHISSFELDFNQTTSLKFQINVLNKLEEEKTGMKIIECQFFDETIFLSFGRFENGSLWLDSDYFSEQFILNLNMSQLADVEVKLNSTLTPEAILVEILEEQFFSNAFIIFVSMLKTMKESTKKIQRL